MFRSVCAALLFVIVSVADAQPLSQRERADAITRELHADGNRFDGEHATLWVARDSLSPQQSEDFVRLLDQGIVAIRAYLGPHVDEPDDPRRIEVYLSPRVGISHVRGDHPTMVYMPSRRIRAMRDQSRQGPGIARLD